MNKQEPLHEAPAFKIGIVLFTVGLIIFLSTKKDSFSESDSSSFFIFGWFIASIISIIVYVFLARYTFKVNEIVSNQEKTNQLLESINKSLSAPDHFLEESDVNNPDNLKKIIDKLK